MREMGIDIDRLQEQRRYVEGAGIFYSPEVVIRYVPDKIDARSADIKQHGTQFIQTFTSKDDEPIEGYEPQREHTLIRIPESHRRTPIESLGTTEYGRLEKEIGYLLQIVNHDFTMHQTGILPMTSCEQILDEYFPDFSEVTPGSSLHRVELLALALHRNLLERVFRQRPALKRHIIKLIRTNLKLVTEHMPKGPNAYIELMQFVSDSFIHPDSTEGVALYRDYFEPYAQAMFEGLSHEDSARLDRHRWRREKYVRFYLSDTFTATLRNPEGVESVQVSPDVLFEIFMHRDPVPNESRIGRAPRTTWTREEIVKKLKNVHAREDRST